VGTIIIVLKGFVCRKAYEHCCEDDMDPGFCLYQMCFLTPNALRYPCHLHPEGGAEIRPRV
jgi:hypothetical protein